MGYRSDVKLVFYTSNDSTIPFSAVKFWFDENFPKHDFADVEVGQNYVLVSYEDVKWYDNYPEVRAVNKAIEQFCETFDANEDTGAHYEMIRVGEELNDIERNYSSWSQYLLDVRREIVFN